MFIPLRQRRASAVTVGIGLAALLAKLRGPVREIAPLPKLAIPISVPEFAQDHLKLLIVLAAVDVRGAELGFVVGKCAIMPTLAPGRREELPAPLVDGLLAFRGCHAALSRGALATRGACGL